MIRRVASFGLLTTALAGLIAATPLPLVPTGSGGLDATSSAITATRPDREANTSDATSAPSDASVTTGAIAHPWRVLVLAYSSLEAHWPRTRCGPKKSVKVWDDYLVNGRPHKGKGGAYLATLAAVRRLPAVVHDWSGGRVEVQETVVELDHALTSLTIGDCQFWPAANDVRADLDRAAARHRFDAVFVLWPDILDFTRTSDWGLTIGPSDDANGAAYTTIAELPEDLWRTGTEPAEILVHEMLHQLIGTAEARGVEDMPDLHRNVGWGYDKDASGSYRTWYSDYLRGLIPEGGRDAETEPMPTAMPPPADPSPPKPSPTPLSGSSGAPRSNSATVYLGLTDEVWAAIDEGR